MTIVASYSFLSSLRVILDKKPSLPRPTKKDKTKEQQNNNTDPYYQIGDNFIAVFISTLILIVAYYSVLVYLLEIVIWQIFPLFPMFCCNENPKQSTTCRNWLFPRSRIAWPRAKESAILASMDRDLLPTPLYIKTSTNRWLLIFTRFLFFS